MTSEAAGSPGEALRPSPFPDMNLACMGCTALDGLQGNRRVKVMSSAASNTLTGDIYIGVSVTDSTGRIVRAQIVEDNAMQDAPLEERTAAAEERMKHCPHHLLDDRNMPNPDCPAGLRAEPRRKPSPRPR